MPSILWQRYMAIGGKSIKRGETGCSPEVVLLAGISEDSTLAKDGIETMHEWRTKFAWSMILYAVALVVAACLGIAEFWAFRDRAIALFHRNPGVAVLGTGGLLFAVGSCLFAASFCLDIRRYTSRHDDEMRAREAERLCQKRALPSAHPGKDERESDTDDKRS